MIRREAVAVLAQSHRHFLQWVGWLRADALFARAYCRYVYAPRELLGVSWIGYVNIDGPPGALEKMPLGGMAPAILSRVPFEYVQAMGSWYAIVNGSGAVAFGPLSFADVVKTTAAFYAVGGLGGGF